MTAPVAATEPTGSAKATITEDTVTGTEYVILEESTADNAWKKRGTVIATSSDAAIRKHIGTPAPQAASTLVAIPARSWKPVKVTPQTVTTLKLENAK